MLGKCFGGLNAFACIIVIFDNAHFERYFLLGFIEFKGIALKFNKGVTRYVKNETSVYTLSR
ncbi:hypothetical protein AO364_1159 [Moraxella catarrhalis]|nr:hypothetical protein AO364_1159 [Moraxella catarrhalis]